MANNLKYGLLSIYQFLKKYIMVPFYEERIKFKFFHQRRAKVVICCQSQTKYDSNDQLQSTRKHDLFFWDLNELYLHETCLG